MDLLDIKSRPEIMEKIILGALLSDNAIEQIMPVSFSRAYYYNYSIRVK